MAIILKHLATKNILSYTLGNELRVSSMHEKIEGMLYNIDAFIALNSGQGTLKEVFNIVSWAHLNIHQKPLGLLNVNGFYDGMMSFLEHVVEQELMSQVNRCILVSASNADQLIDELQLCASELNPLVKQATSHTEDSNKKRELDTTLQL